MAYPPLPESAYGDFEAPVSPKSRAYSKAPSISPSDSPSQMPKVRPVRTGSQLNGSECHLHSDCYFLRVVICEASCSLPYQAHPEVIRIGVLVLRVDLPHLTRLGHPFVVVLDATATTIAFRITDDVPL